MVSFILPTLYIDPGSGSLLFQMLLSGLLTIMVFFKRITLYVKSLFSGKGNNSSDNQTEHHK